MTLFKHSIGLHGCGSHEDLVSQVHMGKEMGMVEKGRSISLYTLF